MIVGYFDERERPYATRYLPSLLGRDVLNTVRMEYDFPAGRLEFAVNVSQ